MNNFGISFRYSAINKFNKSFFIINGLIVLAIFILGNVIPIAVNSMNEENNKPENATSIYFYSENTEVSEMIAKQFNENIEQNMIASVVSKYDNSEFDVDNDNPQYMINLDTYEVRGTEDLAVEDKYVFDAIIKSIQTTLLSIDLQAKYNVSTEDISKIANLGQYEFEKVELNPEEGQMDGSYGIYYVINAISSIATYVFVLLGLNLVGNEVLEEKTSRAMEIIVTSTNVVSHLYAKVLATFLYVISMLLIILTGFIITLVYDYFVFDLSDIFKTIVDVLKDYFAVDNVGTIAIYFALIVILLIISLVFFMSAAGILASVTSSAEEYSKIISPLIILLIIPYILAYLPFISATILKVVAFLPGIAIFVVPNLYIQEEVGFLFITAAIIVQAIYITIVSTFGLKIYRAGVLNYSDRSFVKIMIDVVKSK